MSLNKIGVFVVALLVCSSVFAEDYEIRLTRSSKVGDKYELIASGSVHEQMTISSGGKIIQESNLDLTGTLEGTVEVLEIDEKQRGKSIKLTVSKFLMSSDGDAQQKEALPKSTEVTVYAQGGQEVFLVNGTPVSANIAKLLGAFIPLPKGEVTDDDVLGTKDRKKVGDSWVSNSALMAEDLVSAGMKVDTENIKSSTKLEKVVVVDGTECLRLNSQLEINDFTILFLPKLSVKRAKMSATFWGDFPVDTSIRSLSGGGDKTMEFVAKGKTDPQGPESTISMKQKESIQIKVKPLN